MAWQSLPLRQGGSQLFCAKPLTQARTPTPGRVPLAIPTGAVAGTPAPTPAWYGGSILLVPGPSGEAACAQLITGTLHWPRSCTALVPATETVEWKICRGGHCLHRQHLRMPCLCKAGHRGPRTALPHGRRAGACAHVGRSRHHLRQERRRLHLAGAGACAGGARGRAIAASAPCIRRRNASQCMLPVNMAGVLHAAIMPHNACPHSPCPWL